MLRAEESCLLKKVVVGYVKYKADDGYPNGSILMESPHQRTAKGLLDLAQDQEAWKLHAKNVVERVMLSKLISLA